MLHTGTMFAGKEAKEQMGCPDSKQRNGLPVT